MLLNLLRGTGPEGLGGIPPVRGRIVRPLLQTSRAEIEDYLQENGLSHVEDSTNEDTHYAHNRLRRELWPRLETINPALTKAIGRTAEILRRENGYLDTLAAEYLPPSGTAVETARLLSAPEALRSRVMRLLLERTPTGKKDVGAAHIQALLALAAVWRQAQGMGILYDFRGGSVSAKILTPEESDVSFAGSYEFTEADRQQADALPKKLSTENDEEVTALLNKLKMSRDFDGYDTYMTKLTQAKSDIDALYAEIEAINTDIQEQIIPMTEPGLGEKPTVDRLVKRYKALSDHDKALIQNCDAVLAVKAQTDAAQRNLFLIIGGAVVVMVAVTVFVRRRRESK